MRYGITGHRRLPEAAARFATRHWSAVLRGDPAALAVSCLAEGADQLFAEQVLAAGGRLEVIEPCAGYADSFPDPAVRRCYQDLCGAATNVITLPYPEPGKEAYMAAGLLVVERCDHLFAVWDGQPTRGLGGTADVIGYAVTRGRGYTILWPAGFTRS